ncbi:hypothetical protein EDB82DRAFT_567348 [Fusarium venenatum]|uniref:uncharacterized protein n=1 Tax=Fusarium venenatum TaxID=56646 RepID=UPI001D953A6F|nr:hypothetical protein EDB82DRAFT_567348 [Fusarium venenatum]
MAHQISRKEKIADWKKSIFGGACACVVVFVINLVIVIWSTKAQKIDDRHSPGTNKGRSVIFEGSCSTSRNLNVLIHLLINILSSVLLGASNYGMQCLSAPTRADIDKAHANREWLDIGILSVRNLSKISPKRVILWCLLVISSLPLHLLFNSVVYSSLIASSYNVYTFDDTFQQLEREPGYVPKGTDPWSYYMLELAKKGRLDNLTNAECINEYAIPFQTRRSDVILVVDTTNDTESITASGTKSFSCNLNLPSGYEWICPDATCSRTCWAFLPEIKRRLDNWRPFGNRVQYCLSQPIQQTCRLNFDRNIAITILVVNAIKLMILVYAATYPPEEPLFVIGDAIQSFLITPDIVSSGSGLASARLVRKNDNWNQPCINDGKRRRWGFAASKRRWKFSIVIYALALIFAVSFLIRGIVALPGPRDIKSLWDLGFGTVTEVTLIQGITPYDLQDNSLASMAILSNLPQLGFSLLYFQYNGLFTSMAAAKEWSDFGQTRKPLRVSSSPQGNQRSRYFLQLPYKFSIPLLVTSILVHWMLSQSIFVVAIETWHHYWYRDNGGYMSWALVSCGYSPIAMIFVVITAVLMAAAVAVTAYLRFPTFMPVVGSCSLAIAATCHDPDNRPQVVAPLYPLKWGVMLDETGRSSKHCGFSHRYVEEPELLTVPS